MNKGRETTVGGASQGMESPGQSTTSKARPVLLFIVTEDWYFVSHRLGLARAAREAGYTVHVACRTGDTARIVRDAGIVVHPLSWRRSDKGLRSLLAIRELYRLLQHLTPDIVHNVALKPIVLASLASRLAGVKRIVNAVAGLGYAFTASSARARLMRWMVVRALRLGADRPGATYLFQNRDDEAALRQAGAIHRADTALIRGAGIDIDAYRPAPEPAEGPFTITVVSRMLAMKGIADVVAASRLLSAEGFHHRLLLVGPPDADNASSISREQLEEWTRESCIEWLGARNDIAAIWAQSHLAILASHGGEGLPKSLLEAAACGRAIIATDVPGNREIAVAGENALLVPPRDPAAIAQAVRVLATHPEQRQAFAARSRMIAETEFSAARVYANILALYEAKLKASMQ